jgi:hypothetical protein
MCYPRPFDIFLQKLSKAGQSILQFLMAIINCNYSGFLFLFFCRPASGIQLSSTSIICWSDLFAAKAAGGKKEGGEIRLRAVVAAKPQPPRPVTAG